MSYLKENIEIAYLHLDRLKRLSLEIITSNMLDGNLDDFGIIKTIDAFIYRFVKLQDYMGQKLFRNFLREIGEDDDGYSFLDILDKLEKLNTISSAYDWIEIRKLRNKLTHEYQNQIQSIKEDIKIALDKVRYFEQVLKNIEYYIKDKRLLE